MSYTPWRGFARGASGARSLSEDDPSAAPNLLMRTDDFDFELPRDLIAQHPVAPRDAARLLVVGDRLEDRRVRDLLERRVDKLIAELKQDLAGGSTVPADPGSKN